MKSPKAYGYDELALISSNLAKSAEKQRNDEVSTLLTHLSNFFEENSPKKEDFSVETLLTQISKDIQDLYPAVSHESELYGNRGSLRCVTWGKKVSAIHKSILTRYEKQKEALFEGKEIWVCEACGYIAISQEVPTICPICKAPSSRFTHIKKEA